MGSQNTSPSSSESSLIEKKLKKKSSKNNITNKNSNNFSNNQNNNNNDEGSNKSFSEFINTNSSYYGIITDSSRMEEQVTSNTQNSITENSIDKSLENKVPTKFEWKEGGENVLLTGSFCNWNQKFVLNKNNNTNFFELILYLPKGTHQFKFIVDDIWKCSIYYPIISDNNNNDNNIFDNSFFFESFNNNNNNNKKKYKKKASSKSIKYKFLNIEKNGLTREFSTRNKESEKVDKIYEVENSNFKYGNYYPDKILFEDTYPTIIPMYYLYKMNLYFCSNQKILGSQKHIDFLDNFNLIYQSYKKGNIPYNIFLNHLYMVIDNNGYKFNDKNNINSYNNKNYIKITTINRFKGKSTTYVYIKPKKNFHNNNNVFVQ